jgi:hypothetical protein
MPPHWVLEECESQCKSTYSEVDTSTPKEIDGPSKFASIDDDGATPVKEQIMIELPQQQFAAGVMSSSTMESTATGTSTDAPTIATAETSLETGAAGDFSSSTLGFSSLDGEGRLVHFNTLNNIVHEIWGRQELTPQDYALTWYMRYDFERISSWNRMTVKFFRQQAQGGGQGGKGGGGDEDREHCIRGLEHRLKGQNELRQTTKTNAIYAVLMEQSKHRKTMGAAYYGGHPLLGGDENCNSVTPPSKKKNYSVVLAKVYREHTLCCVTQAYEQGLQDEKDVKAMNVVGGLPPAPTTPRSQRRSSVLHFDEDDLKELRLLDEDEEAVPDDSHAPGATLGHNRRGHPDRHHHHHHHRGSRHHPRGSTGGGGGASASSSSFEEEEEEGIINGKKKHKKFSRFSKLFQGKKKGHSKTVSSSSDDDGRRSPNPTEAPSRLATTNTSGSTSTPAEMTVPTLASRRKYRRSSM